MSDGVVTVDEEGHTEHRASALTSTKDGKQRWSLAKFPGAKFMPSDDSYIATSKAILDVQGNPIWLWFGAPRGSHRGQAQYWCGQDCIADFPAFSSDGTRFVVMESTCGKQPSSPLLSCGVPERNIGLFMGEWEKGRKVLWKQALPLDYVTTPHFYYFSPDNKLFVLDVRKSSLDEWNSHGKKSTSHFLKGALVRLQFFGGRTYIVTKQNSGDYTISNDSGDLFRLPGGPTTKAEECLGEGIWVVSESEYLRIRCTRPPLASHRYDAQILDIVRGALIPTNDGK